MNCRKVRLELTDYLDNQLDQQTTAAVQIHLQKCQLCSKEAAFLKSYHQNLSTLETKEAPADFEAKFQRRLTQSFLNPKTSRPFILKPFGRPALVGLATVLVIFLAFNYFNVTVPEEKLARQLSPTKPISKEAPVQDAAELNKGVGLEPLRESEEVSMPVKSKSEINQGALTLTISIAKTMSSPMAASKRTFASEADESIVIQKAEQNVNDIDSITKIRDIIALMEGKIIFESAENDQYRLLEIIIPGMEFEDFVLRLKEIGNVIFEDEQVSVKTDPLLRIKLRVNPGIKSK